MTEHTHASGRLRRTLSRLTRAGDVPVVVMLAWAGWLAVPWSFSGLAQARAAAAAAANPPQPPDTTYTTPYEPPPVQGTSYGAPPAQGATSYGAPPASGTTPTTYGLTLPYGRLVAPAPDITSPDLDGDAVQGRLAVERARIAGEVHDAAGHGLAAIAMQAKLALLMFDENPAQARASLEAIRDTSTEALAHLRSALDTIDPAPDPDDLVKLIDGVRAAGLQVDFEPAVSPIPTHLRGTVFRVVRESLTNVLRHAGPTSASVRLANDPCAFVLEVADHGTAVPWKGMTEGRGVKGMRAHVTAAGGHLTAGPHPDGGFTVVARFPQPPTHP